MRSAGDPAPTTGDFAGREGTLYETLERLVVRRRADFREEFAKPSCKTKSSPWRWPVLKVCSLFVDTYAIGP